MALGLSVRGRPMGGVRLAFLALGAAIAALSVPMVVTFVGHGYWAALVCPALNAVSAVLLVRIARRFPEPSAVVALPRQRRSILTAVVAAAALAFVSAVLVLPICDLCGYADVR